MRCSYVPSGAPLPREGVFFLFREAARRGSHRGRDPFRKRIWTL